MSTKRILLFKDVAAKLTGISTPFGGLSWQSSETERKIAKRVINFLEDRRILYNPGELELPQHCISSVVEIRHFLTEKIAELGEDSELVKNLKTMRLACRKFLDSAQPFERDHKLPLTHVDYNVLVFCSALGEMRGTFGMCLAQILLSYELDIEEDLATILPASYKVGEE